MLVYSQKEETNLLHIHSPDTHRELFSPAARTVITEKDPGKQVHDHQWPERRALHQLPHRNFRILTTLNALCADTNAAL